MWPSLGHQVFLSHYFLLLPTEWYSLYEVGVGWPSSQFDAKPNWWRTDLRPHQVYLRIPQDIGTPQGICLQFQEAFASLDS
jgi:hypothetical protein